VSTGRKELSRVITGFASAMKPLGFTKHASSLWRENPESRDLVAFSGRSDKESGTFTFAVDYSVFLKAFDPFYRNDLDLTKCTTGNADFGGRLGQANKHWPIESSGEVGPLVSTLVDLARKEMLPFLEAHNTVEKTLALLLPSLNDKYLDGRVAVDIMILARLCGQPGPFLEAQLRAQQKLGSNPQFLQKAQRFVATLRT
jgi:hypothetical protein